VIGSMIASEAMHLLVGETPPASVGHALIFDLRSMALDRVPIPRDPECGTCGAPSRVLEASATAAAAHI